MRWLVLGFLLALGALAATPTLIPSREPDWPQFRGARPDGISDEKGLLQTWPTEGPKLLWSAKNIGHGFSAPIIAKDRLYITGDVANEHHIFAFDLSGKLLWTATNGAAWKDQFPGARASVTYSDGRIYHENAHGIVSAYDAANGKPIWSVDLLKEYNAENITWGLSECLLVDDRAVYATAGGRDALVVALDKKTGAEIWRSPALQDSRGVNSASYVSPIFIQFGDRRLIIGCALRNLYCVDAADGEVQWTHPMPTAYSVLAMPPALVGDGIFMTAPHGKGGKLFKLLPPKSGKIGIEEVWTSQLDTCQGGVIVTAGKIIGSYYPGRKGWAAIDTKTGKVLYEQPDYIKGAPLFADNRIYTLNEDGWMRLLEPTATEFKTHGQFRLAQAKSDAWAHPVIHNARLYLRYHDQLSCYDVKAP